MRTLFCFILTIIQIGTSNAQNYGTFTDPRDGEVYKTIAVTNVRTGESTVWFAENLRFKSDSSWVYNNDEENMAKVGRLYSWEAACNACPAGWRLPAHADWEKLVDAFGGNKGALAALKSTEGWGDETNTTNSSGFSALPGGVRNLNGEFSDFYSLACWWSSTETHKNGAWGWYFYSHNKRVHSYRLRKELGQSVRCLKERML